MSSSIKDRVDEEEKPASHTNFWARATRVFTRSSASWIFVVLIILVAVFAVATPPGTFFAFQNLLYVLSDSAALLILAAGATIVIISDGLDLSAGSVMTFAAVSGNIVMANMSQQGTTTVWPAIIVGTLVALVAGAAWGALNGVLIAYAKLPPFIVTLGSLGAALGAARLLSGGTTASGAPAELQNNIGLTSVWGIPTPFIIAAVVVALLGFMLSYSRFGERIYVTGSSSEAAVRAGLGVKNIQVRVYLLSGLLAGLAGVLDLARFSVATVATGHTTELIAAVAAAVIGGASLYGGVGSMVGTVIGVFIPVVLASGFLIMGIERFWQDVAVGIVLIAAVAFDQWRRGREMRL